MGDSVLVEPTASAVPHAKPLPRQVATMREAWTRITKAQNHESL